MLACLERHLVFLGDELVEHRLGVAAQVEFESNVLKRFIMFQFQAISSRRFQSGFDWVNLHRLTWGRPPTMLLTGTSVLM